MAGVGDGVGQSSMNEHESGKRVWQHSAKLSKVTGTGSRRGGGGSGAGLGTWAGNGDLVRFNSVKLAGVGCSVGEIEGLREGNGVGLREGDMVAIIPSFVQVFGIVLCACHVACFVSQMRSSSSG